MFGLSFSAKNLNRAKEVFQSHPATWRQVDASIISTLTNCRLKIKISDNQINTSKGFHS